MAAEPAVSEWGFTGAADASSYLRDVQRLWTAWVVGLAVLMTGSFAVLVAGGVVVIALLIYLSRPLQRRAEALVALDAPQPAGTAADAETAPPRRDRERVVQALAYGEGPLREAVEMAGRSRTWLLGRRAVLGATAVTFALVVFQILDG